MAAISAQAYNVITRNIQEWGIFLSHDQADTLGEAGLAWLHDRLGLSLSTTDEGVSGKPTLR